MNTISLNNICFGELKIKGNVACVNFELKSGKNLFVGAYTFDPDLYNFEKIEFFNNDLQKMVTTLDEETLFLFKKKIFKFMEEKSYSFYKIMMDRLKNKEVEKVALQTSIKAPFEEQSALLNHEKEV